MVLLTRVVSTSRSFFGVNVWVDMAVVAAFANHKGCWFESNYSDMKIGLHN